VFLSRDADFRAGESLRRHVACRVYSRKGGLLGGLTLVTKSFLPGIWLCFSFTYSRGSSRGFPLRSRFLVLAALLVPVGVSLLFREQLAPVFRSERVGRNLVASPLCGGQNTEWLFAAGHCAGSYESGEDLPIGCRDDAVEN
jgi:hypothetical protein